MGASQPGEAAAGSATAYAPVPMQDQPGSLVAVAGNLACSPQSPAYNHRKGSAGGCAMERTSDLILAAGDAVDSVLAVGDLQYEHGEWDDIQASYDPTWGRLKAKTHPVPGSHEYSIAGAPDYFRYWGERAHPERKSNYSFEVGGWKIYALSSSCSSSSCSPGGDNYEWLKKELAGQSPDQCQLAYWHHPIQSVGQFGDNVTMPKMAHLLHDAGVDVIVNAHDHNYQRWARITPESTVDADNGYRFFIVGSGGINHHRFYALDPMRHAGFETGTDKEFGVLFLKLNPSGYAWEFRTTTGRFTDTGRESCRRTPGTPAVPVPTTAAKPVPVGQPIPGNHSNLPFPPAGVAPRAAGETMTATWQPPSRPGTAGAVDLYRVSVFGAEPGHPTEMTPIAQRTVAATSTSVDFDMHGVPGWSLRVSVEARNPDGWGNPSVLSNAVTGPSGGGHTHSTSHDTVPAGWTALPADHPLPPVSTPGPPRHLRAVPGNGSATVSWAAPSVDGGLPITGYAVYANPGGLVASVGVDQTQVQVDSLINDAEYTFQAVAINEVGDSAPTNESPVTTPTKEAQPTAKAPTAPSDVDAQPGNRSATVTWSTPSNDGGAAVTSYTVSAQNDPHRVTVDGALWSARVDGLVPGKSYRFTVTAKNAAGSSAASAPSAAVTILGPTGTVPTQPAKPVAVAGTNSAAVSWKAPTSDGGSPLTGYVVIMRPSGRSMTVAPTTRQATFSDLTAGTAYRFIVFAVNKSGRSAQSDETQPVVPTAPPKRPGAPWTVVAAAGDGFAKVAWTAPGNDGGAPIVAYTVVATGSGASARVTRPGVREAVVRGLKNGTTYRFTVIAENRVGLSAPSAPSAPVTPTNGESDPPMPQVPGPDEAAREVVSWSAAAGSPAAKLSEWVGQSRRRSAAVAAGVTAVILSAAAAYFWRRRRRAD
ncbi:fibronectin type III domain-containing protein [Actinoplanes sp. NPDC049668]|uniref:fibronectin type III domain-containing protein n=1 Tax=unclassified Actinoplanes TaxID=2626549 RepID=UPI0033B6F830